MFQQNDNGEVDREVLRATSKQSTRSQKSIISGKSEKPINIPSSKASKNLKNALTASSKLQGTQKQFSESYLNRLMLDIASSYDLRQTIFGCFYRVGYDLHELSATEKQKMEIIQLYPYLKNGEIWKDIQQEMIDNKIKPTSDDRHWIETSIEESREQTEAAVLNQTKFAQEI